MTNSDPIEVQPVTVTSHATCRRLSRAPGGPGPGTQADQGLGLRPGNSEHGYSHGRRIRAVS
eukprot:613065-Hanusia_phi.AAC.2